MVRPLRIEFAGALYHVISRGNERRGIVLDDADRRKRVDWLRRTVETYGWRLHAFVLMTNHDHLFVETPRPAIVAAVAEQFEVDPGDWARGRRSNDAGRAVAAYLARRRFGYPATAVAATLGYHDHGSVGQAVRRVEQGSAQLQQTGRRLGGKLLNT